MKQTTPIEVKEFREVTDEKTANDLLDEGWICCMAYIGTQRCFSKVTLNNGVERIQPYDKLLKIFLMGRVK